MPKLTVREGCLRTTEKRFALYPILLFPISPFPLLPEIFKEVAMLELYTHPQSPCAQKVKIVLAEKESNLDEASCEPS